MPGVGRPTIGGCGRAATGCASGSAASPARDWIRAATTVTVTGYAQRHGVDRYTTYDDLTVLGVTLPESARRWAQRPPATPRRSVHGGEQPDDSWIMLDGGRFFVAGHTPGGAPYGFFADRLPHDDPLWTPCPVRRPCR